jgi:hypothetical protein
MDFEVSHDARSRGGCQYTPFLLQLNQSYARNQAEYPFWNGWNPFKSRDTSVEVSPPWQLSKELVPMTVGDQSM